jgi:hypothetical protein
LKIKVERSGGIAGIVRSTELDSKELPCSLVSKLKKIIQDSESSSIPLKVTPRGAADHYTYKISVRDGSNIQVIECNQFNLQDDFKPLISYFEKHSKRD